MSAEANERRFSAVFTHVDQNQVVWKIGIPFVTGMNLVDVPPKEGEKEGHPGTYLVSVFMRNGNLQFGLPYTEEGQAEARAFIKNLEKQMQLFYQHQSGVTQMTGQLQFLVGSMYDLVKAVKES